MQVRILLSHNETRVNFSPIDIAIIILIYHVSRLIRRSTFKRERVKVETFTFSMHVEMETKILT